MTPELSEETVEAMARAHDAEDAAQRGEPSPWDATLFDPITGIEYTDFREDRLAAMRAALSASGLLERERVLTERLVDTSAHLAAAISLLERSPKKAAASDKMFDQMLADYRAALRRARTALRNPLKAD